ncbi:MAG: hypothetical protein ACTSXQ_06215 [Alphaproteobacteria bacterium]
MTPKPYRCPLGRLQKTKTDKELIKRKGWQEDGILVINLDQATLSLFDRALLEDIGNKLYGTRKAANDDRRN